jgi:hypothetical protein
MHVVRSVCMGGIVQETGMKLTHSTQISELLPFPLQVPVFDLLNLMHAAVVYLCISIVVHHI